MKKIVEVVEVGVAIAVAIAVVVGVVVGVGVVVAVVVALGEQQFNTSTTEGRLSWTPI